MSSNHLQDLNTFKQKNKGAQVEWRDEYDKTRLLWRAKLMLSGATYCGAWKSTKQGARLSAADEWYDFKDMPKLVNVTEIKEYKEVDHVGPGVALVEAWAEKSGNKLEWLDHNCLGYWLSEFTAVHEVLNDATYIGSWSTTKESARQSAAANFWKHEDQYETLSCIQHLDKFVKETKAQAKWSDFESPGYVQHRLTLTVPGQRSVSFTGVTRSNKEEGRENCAKMWWDSTKTSAIMAGFQTLGENDFAVCGTLPVGNPECKESKDKVPDVHIVRSVFAFYEDLGDASIVYTLCDTSSKLAALVFICRNSIIFTPVKGNEGSFWIIEDTAFWAWNKDEQNAILDKAKVKLPGVLFQLPLEHRPLIEPSKSDEWLTLPLSPKCYGVLIDLFKANQHMWKLI